MLLVGVAEQLVSERALWKGETMLVHGKVHIVAPFGPPGGADEELAVAQATKVGLQYEWILDLYQC